MSKDNRSGEGGARNEAGGEYRRALAALFVAHALNGAEFKGLPVGGPEAIVETVALETDAPVDDILVGLSGRRLYVQAKRTLRFGRPLRETVEQWLRAVREDDFDPDQDFVAAGAGVISAPLKLAALALRRRRADPGAVWSLKEREQIEKLEGLVRALGGTAEETSLVLSRAVLIERRVEEEHDADADQGRLLLDGHVVARGEGGRTWRELVSAAGEAARLRIGRDAGGWLEELRRRGIPLTADAERSRAGALERQRQAVERYRERLRERGETVDLTALGARLPLLQLGDLDAEVTVRDPEANERDEKELLWAFRRRGRVILTGLPGGGKSTALHRVAGEWAMKRDWALPIVVSLRRLAEKERFRKRPLRDELLDLAAEAAEAEDRSFVRDALDRALADGEAVLFLDGLDEAADRSLALASEINTLLADVHRDTDVLLATRDAAYSDAQILGFRDLVLNSPRDARKTVRAVLSAIAEQTDVKKRDAWVERRTAWVDRMFDLDSQLSETPLLPILLALLAGESEVGDLPTTRARILADVIEGVVERHEINRELELAALPRGHEARALIDAFPRIAATLAAADGTAPRAVLADALRPYLQEEWGLAPGPSRRTAEEVLRFWDESGIFVARGKEKRTSPRLQLFLEIGAALEAASRPGDKAPQFVASLAQRVDRHETLILAAGISIPIADALIAHAVDAQDERLALAAATALAQGGEASESELRQLIDLLIEYVSAGDDEAWRVFTTLVQIRAPEDLKRDILSVLAAFDPAHEAVGRALAALEWHVSGERRDNELEAGLCVTELPRLARRVPREGHQVDWHDFMVDQTFMRVKIDAAAELLPRRPELAPVVAAAMEHTSLRAHEDLAEILRQNGHEALATEALRKAWNLSDKTRRTLAEQFGDLDADLERTLMTIATLARPAELTRAQARRLDELATFVETLDLNNGTAWVRIESLEKLREPWYRLIAALGDFDMAVLAAQAELVQNELAADSAKSHTAYFSLFDETKGAPLESWHNVIDNYAGRKLAIHLLAGRWALARVAATALATHPDRVGTREAIEARLPAVPRESKQAAVWAALNLADDFEACVERFAAEADEGVREAVASLVRLTDGHSPTALGRKLATDAARKVQLATLAGFGKEVNEPAPDLIELLHTLAASSPRPFTCYKCDTENDPDHDSCESCHTVTEKPADKAQELLRTLGEQASDTPRQGAGTIT